MLICSWKKKIFILKSDKTCARSVLTILKLGKDSISSKKLSRRIRDYIILFYDHPPYLSINLNSFH